MNSCASYINSRLVNEYLHRFCFAWNRLCNIMNISNIAGHVCDICKTLLWIFVKSLCIMATKRLCSSLSKHATSCSKQRQKYCGSYPSSKASFYFMVNVSVSELMYNIEGRCNNLGLKMFPGEYFNCKKASSQKICEAFVTADDI